MIGGATVLFLDEPSAGVDPAARRQLWNTLQMEREEGKTIVLTSHRFEYSLG